MSVLSRGDFAAEVGEILRRGRGTALLRMTIKECTKKQPESEALRLKLCQGIILW